MLFTLLLLASCQSATDTEIRLASLATLPLGHAASEPPHFTEHEFVTADGARLPLRKWLPTGPASAVILALHGFGDYSHAFEMPGQKWAGREIATYAYDQRGFGGAPGRGLWSGTAQLAADAITAAQILHQLYPGRPLYLLGESMGGAIATVAATGTAGDGWPAAPVDGVILSAPAVWGRATMDLLPRLTLFAGVRLFPEAVLTGRGLRIRASDNIPMLEALSKDALVLKGARIDTVYGLVDLMDDALATAPHLATPTLILYGAHDEVIPRPPIEEFVASLPADPDHLRRLAYYQKGYHLLLRDLEGAAVADDVASWIANHRAPLPSNADAGEGAQPWPPVRGGDG